MSVTLNIKTLAKKVLKCTEEQFLQRRSLGMYKTAVSKATKSIMENLNIFGDNSLVVKENVSQKDMYNVVKRLLTNKSLSETEVYIFSTNRASKSGNYFLLLVKHFSEIASIIIIITIF